MLIPRFRLSQTSTHLTIEIRCPYVKFSSKNDQQNGIEVDLPLADEFYFSCKPYYLHLYLPGRVIEKNIPDYQYDLDTFTFKFNYEKETQGEQFPNLDMITSLLHKREKLTKKTIEEIHNDDAEDSSTDDDEDEDEPLWNQMRQLDIDDRKTEDLIPSFSYGFNHQYNGLFSNFDSEYSIIFDNSSPDSLPTSSIRSSRLDRENQDFNVEHYLIDKEEFDDEEAILGYSLNLDDQLSDQDRDDLKDLKYKEFLIDNPIPIYLGLIDLLYCFSYDQRITQGESCCESPWNIHKLSATLSWFDSFDDLPSVLIACCRRTLTYPLIRSFKLAKKCFQDVIDILSRGKTAILQCLLQMRRLFLDEEHRYLLNNLYINDYCLWIQTNSQEKWLNSLVDAMKHMINDVLDEKSLDLNIVEMKPFSWKVNLCETTDSDDDEDDDSDK